MSDLKIQRDGDAEIQLASDCRIAVAVPINFKRRSGRKLVTLPDGEVLKPRPWDKEPSPLQRALARAHRWQRMLDSGEVRTQQELADLEGVSNPYVSRMLRLTTLAPDLVAAILDDDLPDHIKLFDLAIVLPVLWDEQRAMVAALISAKEFATVDCPIASN